MQQRQRRTSPYALIAIGIVIYAVAIAGFWALSRSVFDMEPKSALGLAVSVISFLGLLVVAMTIVSKYATRY